MMNPDALLDAAVACGLADVRRLGELAHSCCPQSSVAVVDFDAVKDKVFAGVNDKPKSCDAVLAAQGAMTFVEMKSVLKTWEYTLRLYERKLKDSGYKKQDILAGPLPEELRAWRLNALLKHVREEFALPEKYYCSCDVLDTLADRMGMAAEWKSVTRNDEFVFVHDLSTTDKNAVVISHSLYFLFKRIFKDVRKKTASQVRKISPLMLSCTEFETKYTPAKA